MTTQLKLYNTLTRSKEVFEPIDPANVRMYVCGPTVYDHAHIGNARPVIVFDVLFRLLRHIYGKEHVTYARNITDIDDKINKRAFERWNRTGSLTGEIRKLTDGTLAQFHKDIDALGVLRAGEMLEPRATDFVANDAYDLDMVRMIERLIARGHAYAAEGHVLFDVPSMPDYGRLARRNSDDMIAGARVDVAPYKKSPMDFVLWKPSDPATEPGWESPWGYGRPGWHIECSAMSGALLGETFDIHAGGLDLIFPHHENEIAQSCCAFGTPKMASVWMHNGFLQVEGQKMSKSLGNFVTIDDLLNTTKFGGRSWPGEVLRLAMLKTHYRQPIDWTVRGLEEAYSEYYKLRRTAADFSTGEVDPIFIDALSDDLNTPIAVSRLHTLHNLAQKGDLKAGGALRHAFSFLGLGDVLQRGSLILLPPSKEGELVNGKKRTSEDVMRDMLSLITLNDPIERLDFALQKTSWTTDVKEQIEVYFRFTRFTERNVLAGEVLKFVDVMPAINDLITARNAARAAKNWPESDRLRAELEAMGLQLKDGKDEAGNPVTTWEVKR